MRGISLAGQADGHLSGLLLAILTQSAEKSASLNEPPMRAKISRPVAVAWSFKLSQSAEKSASLNEPPMRAKISRPVAVAWSFKLSLSQASQFLPTSPSTSSARSSMVRGGEKNSSTRYLISSASSDASPLQSFSTVHSWIMTSGKSERSATAARSDRGGLFTGVGLIVALIGVESVILSIPDRKRGGKGKRGYVRLE